MRSLEWEDAEQPARVFDEQEKFLGAGRIRLPIAGRSETGSYVAVLRISQQLPLTADYIIELPAGRWFVHTPDASAGGSPTGSQLVIGDEEPPRG